MSLILHLTRDNDNGEDYAVNTGISNQVDEFRRSDATAGRVLEAMGMEFEKHKVPVTTLALLINNQSHLSSNSSSASRPKRLYHLWFSQTLPSEPFPTMHHNRFPL